MDSSQIYKAKVTQMEADPIFRDMSYDDQIEERKYLLASIIKDDPAYASLPANKQIEVLDNVANSRRPVFKNAEHSKYWSNAFDEAEQGRLSKATLSLASASKGLYSESLAANLALKGIQIPTARSINYVSYLFGGNDVWRPDLDALIGNDGDKVVSYLRRKGEEKGFVDDAYLSDDIKNAMKEQLRFGGQGNSGENVGRAVGFASDFLVFHATWEKFAGKKLSAQAMKIASETKGVKSYLARVALPAFISGTSSGAYGIAKEHLLGVLNDDDSKKQYGFKKIARTFGDYALLDYAINVAAGSVLPYLGSLKHIVSKGASTDFSKMPPKDFDETIDLVSKGLAPQELIDQLDDVQKNYLYGQAQIRNMNLKVDTSLRIRPYDDLVVRGESAGITTYQDPSTGKYWIYTPQKDGKMSLNVADDIVSAKRTVSDGMRKKLDSLSGSEKDAYLLTHTNILAYSQSERLIDGALDPKKVKDAVDSDTAKVLRNPVKGRQFLSPTNRPYIGAVEVDAYKKAFSQSGVPVVFQTDIPPDVFERVSKGEKIFTGGGSVSIQDGTGETQVFALLRNPADAKSIIKATGLADKAISKGATQTAETLRNMYLMEGGFDGIVYNPSKIEVFYPDKLKIVTDVFDPVTGTTSKISNAISKSSSLPVQETILREFTAKLGKKVVAGNKKVLVDVASSFKGDLNKDDIQKFSRLVLSDSGISANNVFVKMSNKANAIEADDAIMAFSRVDGGTGQITIEVPRSITTPKAQKQFITELFDELQSVSETMGKKIQLPGKSFTAAFSKGPSRFTSPFTDLASSEAWLKSNVEDFMNGSFNKTARGYSVQFPNGKEIVAKDIDTLTDRLMVSNIDLPYLKYDMANQGIALSQIGDTLVVRGKGIAQPVTAKTIPDLLDKLNYRPSKISNMFAPVVSEIDESGVTLTFKEGRVVGAKQSIKQFFSKFEDMEYMGSLRRIKSFDKGDVFLSPSGSYEITMPSLGVSGRKFKTAKEATEFVNGKWKTYDSIKSMAYRKGLETWFDNGVLNISDGKTVFKAKTHDEIATAFAKYPDTPHSRDLLEELDPTLSSPIQKVLRAYDTSILNDISDNPIKPYNGVDGSIANKAVRMNVKQTIAASVENMDYFMESTFGNKRTITNKIGKENDLYNEGLLKKYKDVETSRRIAEVDIEKTDKVILGIFTQPNGRLLDIDRRRAIFYHAGAQTLEEQSAAIEWFGKLTSEEQTITSHLRRLMGENVDGRLTGLAGKFNIDTAKFLNNYMPRVMDWATKNQEALSQFVTADELFENALKGVNDTTAPKRLSAFFKNNRVSDILSFKAVDDPIETLMHYQRVGHRELYMGPSWESLYNEMKGSNVGVDVLDRMNRYRELVMGLGKTDGAKVVENFGEALGKALKMDGGKDLAAAYFSVNYLTNMGFRPWLAIRNTFQVFNVLAPRFGNEWVNKGVKIASNASEAKYDYYKSIGLITDSPPIVNQISSKESLLGKTTRAGLFLFKRSDDITRVVAFETGASRFDDALSKMKRGVLKNSDEFLKESGIKKLDPSSVIDLKRIVDVGTDEAYAAARTYYGLKVSDDTMFKYAKSQTPAMFTRSFFGQMLGQYGTYSAGYRANIYRGLQHGSASDKLAFIGRFIGNNLAFYGALTAVGIKAADFIPGAPALFGGGPSFEDATDVIASFGLNYEGERALAKLQRKFLPFKYSQEEGFSFNYPERAPGSIHYRYFKKALKYREEGDYWRAFLAATGTSTVDKEDIPTWMQNF